MQNYNVHEDITEFMSEVDTDSSVPMEFACTCESCLDGEFDDCENGWS